MMTFRVVIRGLAALAVTALVLASCSEKGVVSADNELVRLMLVPAPTELEDGASAQVAVVGVQLGGRQITLSPSRYSIRWTSSNPAILQIEGSGNFVTIRAVAAGRASVSVDVSPLSGGGGAGALQMSQEMLATQVPTDFVLQSPNNVRGLVGAPLPDSVSVRVLDRTGAGVRNVAVEFDVIEGGGSVSKSNAATDSLGFARTSWRLGSPGRNRLRARSNRPRRDIDIDADGQNADPAAISVWSGNSQQGTAGSSLPNRLSVRVVDASSRPLPGVAVSWAVVSGGGSITPQSAPTDDQGVSTVYWTLGPMAGNQTARASVAGLNADFTAAARAGAAARVVKLGGDQQSVAVNTRLTDSLAVQVVDQFGNAVSGASINWSVVTGGGSISPTSGTSGANGVTRAAWTMGPTAGAASARASLPGIAEETFSATAIGGGGSPPPPPPPPPPSNTIVKLSGDGQSGAVATRLTDSIAVRVQNAQGTGVAGVTVTWTVTAGNGSVSPQTRVTNSNGVARTAWTMGPAAGAAGLKATAPNAGEVNFTATATPPTGGGTQLTITKMSGDGQTGTSGTRLADSLVVQVRDGTGSAVSGVAVSWTVMSGNGSVSPATFTTNASGFARTAWTLGSGTGAGSVRASAGNATPVTFTSTANAPTVTQVTVTPAVDTINALNGQITLVAAGRDANNQVVPNTRFTWTSLSPAIATVDTMGIVTARAAGRALIIASAVCCSRADTSAVDVILSGGGVPGGPGSVTLTTSNVNPDTFQVVARWGRATNATGYEWASGASNGAWNRSAQVSDTVATVRVPRVSGTSDYWICVVALNGSTRSADNSCNAYAAPATGGGTPAPVATVTVSPTNPSVGVGSTVQLSATLRDASNNVLTGRTVTWQSNNAAVTVNSAGLATGVSAGSATITATSEGRSGTTTVTVTSTPPPPPTVTAIVVTPPNVTLNTGQQQQFTATATLSNGSTQNNPTVTWTATGGTITTSGLFTAGTTTGSNFRVIASGSGRADTSSVTIQTPPPPPPPGSNHMWENSAECDANDSNVLLCDDFEDGVWYDRHCGNLGSGGLLAQDGWCGTIYNDVGLAAGTARCNNAGFKSLCAATTGNILGDTGNMGDIALRQGVNELWVRFYTKPNTGYQFGAEKMLSFNSGSAGGGGIRFGNLSWNCASTTQSTGNITMGFPAPMDVCQNQNVGNNITITAGNWYFYEVHYKLSSPGQANGVFELWVDNCGPTGTTCPATPTLRMRRTDVNNATRSGELITVLWFEAWSNPESRGERFWDQIKVMRTGPIGFMR